MNYARARIGLICLVGLTGPIMIGQAAEPTVIAEIKVDRPLRDPSICRGPERTYYLTGTVSTKKDGSGTPNWYENDGIYLWKSKDLQRWESLGCVMAFKDQPYELFGPMRWLHKMQVVPDEYSEQRVFGAVSPEIHYVRDTFWLTISMTRQGTGLMRSTTGKPEGPYALVDLLTTRRGDPSLFVDGDTLWWVFDAGYVSKLKKTDPGKHTPKGRKWTYVLDPRPQLIQPEPEANGFPRGIGERGAFMVKAGGKYHLVATGRALDESGEAFWHTYAATADAPDGPYGKRRLLIPGGGQATLFQNDQGQWLAACALNKKPGDATDRIAIVEVEL